MRTIATLFAVVIAIALAWSSHAMLGAYWNVWQFSSERADTEAIESALLGNGTSSIPALRSGLASKNSETRLRCAKILMQMGEDDGEELLLSALKSPLNRRAEALLYEVWDQRNGPDEVMRRKLREAENQPGGGLPQALAQLNDCLNRYPGWADGYARRARMYQQGGEAFEARRDALAALALAPNHFEARVILGRVEMSVDAPYLAYTSFQHAIAINPRLKDELKRDLEDASKALEIEKEKRREEKRRNTPVATLLKNHHPRLSLLKHRV